MGEYAKYRGEEIKIGTCEDMYYLRAADRHKVTPLPGSALGVRYRFPWPTEDKLHPGQYTDHAYSVAIPGADSSSMFDHGTVQFSNGRGLIVSFPCPIGTGMKIGQYPVYKNGYSGDVRLVQQRLMDNGELWAVVQCGGCGAAVRCDAESAQQLIDCCHRAGKVRDAEYWNEIADRIAAGYHHTFRMEGRT